MFVSTTDYGVTKRYCLDNVILRTHANNTTRIRTYGTLVNFPDMHGARGNNNHETAALHSWYYGVIYARHTMVTCWYDNRKCLTILLFKDEPTRMANLVILLTNRFNLLGNKPLHVRIGTKLLTAPCRTNLLFMHLQAIVHSHIVTHIIQV